MNYVAGDNIKPIGNLFINHLNVLLQEYMSRSEYFNIKCVYVCVCGFFCRYIEIKYKFSETSWLIIKFTPVKLFLVCRWGKRNERPAIWSNPLKNRLHTYCGDGNCKMSDIFNAQSKQNTANENVQSNEHYNMLYTYVNCAEFYLIRNDMLTYSIWSWENLPLAKHI